MNIRLALPRRVIGLLVLSAQVAWTQPTQRLAADQIVGSALVIRSAPGFPETIGSKDPIEASVVFDSWKPPAEGDVVRYSDTLAVRWEWMRADSAGWFQHDRLDGAYVYVPLVADREETVLLEGMGHAMVYVNGSPRAGNPYQYKDTREAWEPRFDYSLLPVRLRKGRNDLLFQCNRGLLKVKLHSLRAEVLFNTNDITLPDIIATRQFDALGAVVVINATEHTLDGLMIKATHSGGGVDLTPIPIIQPMTVRKVGFHVKGVAPASGPGLVVGLTLLGSGGNRGAILDTASVTLRTVQESENRKETYVSGIDGSVQYYAILPPNESRRDRPPALVLSLHGAGVEALNQTGSYYPKSWAYVVAPTNRRPYGYDWEDWGRSDAIDVLDIVMPELGIDENRVYLTGHSMGGHGVYHVGSLFPDRFAAIGPSAGWISFWTYRVREGSQSPSPMRQMIQRATLPSDTYTLAQNYGQLGVYILHGSDDDNVRVNQARMMAEHLRKFHDDFVYHEQPGAGHWWDSSDEPGTDCVDWPQMFDFFARHARPTAERVREVNFAAANPGISSQDYWLTIEAQTHQLMLSTADIRLDPGMRRFVGRTENVARLSLDLSVLSEAAPVSVILDSQRVASIPWPHEGKRIWLERRSGTWTLAGRPDPSLKGPQRYGTFKDVFSHRVMLVYGTGGTDEENRWARDKARFDAERFWYQGNGSLEVVADVEFDGALEPDRSVVLYGNASTNRVWKSLLKDSPVDVERGTVRIGSQSFRGDDLNCLMVRPRPGSDVACVGVVAGTGPVGMRLNNKLAYLMPGIGFPDCLVMSARVLLEGESAILAAGFFGLDWSLGEGEFVFGGTTDSR